MFDSFINPVTLDAYTRASLPAPPKLTSKETNLQNIFLAHYSHDACQLVHHSAPVHTLEVIDTNSSSHHKRIVDDQVVNRTLQSGEAFFCPANVEYDISWEDRLGFSLLVFHPRLFEEEFDCEAQDLYPLAGVFDFDIQFLARKIIDDIYAGCPQGSLYSDTYALALGLELVKRLREGRPLPERTFDGLSSRSLRLVKDLIQTKVQQGESLSIESMAEVTGVSQSHFIRLFKASTGKSPHAYYDELRMQLAVHLLKTTDYTIAQVAQRCGFSDQSYFSRRFRQSFHVSPSEFRHQI